MNIAARLVGTGMEEENITRPVALARWAEDQIHTMILDFTNQRLYDPMVCKGSCQSGCQQENTAILPGGQWLPEETNFVSILGWVHRECTSLLFKKSRCLRKLDVRLRMPCSTARGVLRPHLWDLVRFELVGRLLCSLTPNQIPSLREMYLDFPTISHPPSYHLCPIVDKLIHTLGTLRTVRLRLKSICHLILQDRPNDAAVRLETLEIVCDVGDDNLFLESERCGYPLDGGVADSFIKRQAIINALAFDIAAAAIGFSRCMRSGQTLLVIWPNHLSVLAWWACEEGSEPSMYVKDCLSGDVKAVYISDSWRSEGLLIDDMALDYETWTELYVDTLFE